MSLESTEQRKPAASTFMSMLGPSAGFGLALELGCWLSLLGLLLPSTVRGQPALPERTSVPGEALVQKALPAVVTLKMLDRKGAEVGEGTGFLISADGQLVTARHVSQPAPELVAVTSDGKRHRVVGFFGDDRDFDVAILKIDGDGYPWLPLCSTLRTNQWVGLATPQQRGGAAYPTGTVVRVASFADVLRHIITTTPVRPGHSGSPMLNDSGQVVGVVWGSTVDAESFIVPIEVVQDILAQPGFTNAIPFSNRPRGSRIPVVVDADFKAGFLAMERTNWVEANRCFRGLVRRFPYSPTANLLLGMSCRNLQSWPAAKAAFGVAVQHKPQSSVAWLLYGSTLVTMKQYADGTAALREALKLGSLEWNQLLSAWTELATAYAELGDVAKAQEALDGLGKLDQRHATQTRAILEKRHPNLRWPDRKE